MKSKLFGVVTSIAFVFVAAALAFTQHLRAQAATPIPAYAYKVEHFRGSKELKELEPRLNDDARAGWRVSSMAGLANEYDLVVLLEKPASGLH
jgi:hypothetical protein